MRPLKLLSSMASRDVLRDLATRFEAVHGRPVVLEAAGGVEVAKRLRSGEQADVVVLARSTIDALGKEAVLRLDSVTDVALSGIAVAVPESSALPDVSSEAAVRRAVESASSLSYSTGPSGVHLERRFEAWGILDTLRPRIIVPPPGTPVASLLASGRAALGFQQRSELLGVPGIRLAGPLPEGVQMMTTFSGAVLTCSPSPADASRLLAFLATPSTADIKRQYGMDPC